MRYGFWQKLCAHTHEWREMAYRIVCVFGCIMDTENCALPPFSPASFMAPVHSKPLLDICLREEEML